MKIRYTNISKITAFIFVVMVTSCGANNDVNIIVKRKLITDIKKYAYTNYDVQCDDFVDKFERKKEINGSYISHQIWNWFDENGIEANVYSKGDSNKSRLKIQCLYNVDWGMPSITRHFRIELKYVTKVNIKFIDLEKDKTIGEVEYVRHWKAENPKDYIKMMLEKLANSYDKK
ncbi:hypothetical protein ACFL2O_08820 [Thermodesulfobacteriota bacterium]